MTTPPLALSLQAEPPTPQSIAGWQAECYTLSGTARSLVQKAQTLQLNPGDVLEIELENGTRLLVAAEDAERYLGQAAARDAQGTAGLINVGQTLRLSGTHLPPSTSRDGLGAWVLKALRVFKQGPAGVTALVAAGTFQDSQLAQGPGLFALQTDAWQLSPLAQMPHSPEPALLFLHGTASSTTGSFRALWGGDSEVDARAQIAQAYGNRVYGFEHRSLTDSPITNVLALVQSLPVGARLHLVSHSRGGMLGELLARANRIDSEPFTEADIARFTAHAQRTGRQGHAQDAQNLRALNQAMKERAIRVERFVRVAATARGTTLASGRLDRWATVMLNLLGKGMAAVPGMQPLSVGYSLLQNFVLAVVKERTDARVLPGLEAMMPDSPLVALLNAPDVQVQYPLHVIAGDYDGDGLLAWLGDCLSEAFYGGQTDLVVNTPSMSGGARRAQGIWIKPVSGPAVHHLSYFKRNESANALLEALSGKNDAFTPLTGPSRTEIARGGIDPKPRQNSPIALMLPGIMGSHLSVGRRIWMCPLNMIPGGMAELHIDAAGVTPDGWLDTYFERFARHLAQSHEVRPFAYDWRLSIEDAASKFGVVLDQAMTDAETRQQPLRIAAHSMGGLVARLALAQPAGIGGAPRWARFKAISGSRLVQLGTPNNGSHSIAAVLTGRDGFVQMIERWLDWKHDMREFLDIVSQFPGVLELLPWPGADGRAIDGIDYFDPAVWQAWRSDDAENRSRSVAADWQHANGARDGWDAPLVKRLSAAKEAVQKIIAAKLEPEHTLYVAGQAKTPVALRVVDGQMQIGWTERGDGRVPWDSGIPEGVKVWHVDAAHGDLLKHEAAFDDYVQLLETGSCSNLQSSRGARGMADVVFTPAPLTPYTLYPSDEEIMAAALGGSPPGGGHSNSQADAAMANIEIIHGSLAGADTPVLMGSYANDSLRGSAKFLDKHLGGRLQQAFDLWRYPVLPGDALVFPQTQANARPGGAVVVGLGPVGDLQPGELTHALAQGMLEFARYKSTEWVNGAAAPTRLALSAVLVGTGFAGLTVEVGIRCMFEAICRSNRLLARAKLAQRIGTLSVFEDEASRALAAATAAQSLANDSKFRGSVSFDGRIRTAQGGYNGANLDQGGTSGWQRVHITDLGQGGLRFTVVSDHARNEITDQPDQRQAVDGLILSSTNTTVDQPGLSRALFELMLPNALKQALPDLGGLILAVEPGAAVYPWELMRDEAASVDAPLATRIAMVRQLASPRGRSGVSTVKDLNVLVVGDTQSHLPELPGAQQEGRNVASLFGNHAYQVKLLEKAQGQQVMVSLFDEHYRVIHLAAHGSVALDGKGYTGMVLGPNTYLTSAQINQMRHVPELVFINCCHLGSMKPDERPRWGELAANLATQFIEMGCKAVVAAGWAVDDAAASVFADAFYRAMLGGVAFGAAVRSARHDTWRLHPACNTWGAYQAYGDETYRLGSSHQADDWTAPQYLHANQVLAELDRIRARIGPSTLEEKKLYGTRLEKIEAVIQPNFQAVAEVRESLASAWAALNDKPRAIAHYRAALNLANGIGSLRALEQLANLEIRYGAQQMQLEAGRKAGDAFMKTGLARVKALLELGATVERHCLLGCYWKLRSENPKNKGDSQEIAKTLQAMVQAYEAASKLSWQQGQDRDYAPSLNVLDGVLALAARGDTSALEKLAPAREQWLADARRNGQHRCGDARDFLRAYAQVEADRVDALWAMFEARPEQGLGNPDVRKTLLRKHTNLFKLLGNPVMHDCTVAQLRWLMAVLPETGEHQDVRAAVQALMAEIENA